MIFERSTSGLSNLHLFHRVRAIVFVEGGSEHPTLDEIEAGTAGGTSHDAKFWQTLFNRFLPNHQFKFRPVGSKVTLIDLATKVRTNQVTNIIVCMDRDFDDLSGSLIDHENVLYTHGYSWENDVWTLSSTTSVFARLSTATESESAVAEIQSAFRAFENALRWPLLAHSLLVTNRILSVTTADLERTVMRGAGKMPTINCAHLRQAIKVARAPRPRQRVNFRKGRRFSTLDDCYGHLLASFAFNTIAHLLKKHCNIKNLGKDVASSLAIEVSYVAIMRNTAKRQHYRHSFDRLAATLS